ncbi:hypothetical protein ME784_08840 [Lactobacillus delbrueckii]|jgi:hypothetical protein|uniref:hypothetical protein n=1 Tax=Lactobacillus TaxID=1578 RepID=UPI0008A258E0|nr:MULTISPECIES: hypothetical protein [Lactobacillus]OFS81911.1 hypothetical protein HMPREF3168_01955 [Lactobacillus sp. HMSC08B12]GHN20369.1 hypothetical protein ME784_08840 [Lactobacillus delbrueckii]GHN21947.1 hypothetical protein ME785_05050 [Lactobacillus delbrueckii]GHN63101.1 hypothetical protein ME807_15080 [Lactobacillus delbrueckii]
MSYETYELAVKPINEAIQSRAAELVAKVKTTATANSSDLSKMVFDDDFIFFSQDGASVLTKSENYGIKLFSYGKTDVYYEPINDRFVYYEFDSDFGYTMSHEIEESVLTKIFEDISLYTAAMHVVGVDEVTTACLKFRQGVLDRLK